MLWKEDAMSESQFNQGLEAAAAEFTRTVQEAGSRMSAAAEQLSSMMRRLESRAEELDSAATRAQEARTAAEAVQARLENDQAQLSSLMRDLQERIAALSILARPLPESPAQGSANPHEEPPPTSENQTSW